MTLDAGLLDLVIYLRETFLAGFAVFLRVGAAMALLPAFGEQTVPVRIRLALALAFTAIVLPPVADKVAPIATEEALLGLPLLTETLIGLALGAALRVFVFALQTAGAIIAQAISLAQMFGTVGEPQPVVSHLLTVAGLALAVTVGLHVRFAEYLILSYDLLPAGGRPVAAEMTRWGVALIAESFGLAFSLALPFVIGGTLYNLAIGAINRAMPSLMVSLVGAPAQVLGGIVLLALLAPVMLGVWIGRFGQFLSAPFGMP